MREIQVLRKVRTDYGKQIRKEYENGEIKEKRANMTRYEPREDGILNTLTTVLKDNYIMEIEDGVIDMKEIISVGQVSNKGSQAGKVYSTEGLFPTVCACTHGYAIGNILEDSMNELIQVGKLDGKHEQSNRIYSEDGICPTIMAGERKTCTGGYVSPKIFMRDDNSNNIIVEGNYSPSNHNASRIVYDEGIAPTVMDNHGTVTGVKQNIKNKGDNDMWKNNLERFKFKMDEVRVFDVFAGIGSLHQSLKELGIPTKITNLSEIDIDATITYAAGHITDFLKSEFYYPSDDEMKQWLIDRNIGYNYEKDKSSVPRMKKGKLKWAYKASVLLNNLGDISKIKYDEIEDFDLMNFSFSCTDLSGAGKQKGMKNEDGTPTRSGLYIYGIEAIKVKKPKYIMIENVKGLIQKKFIDDFYSIVDEIESLGYKCYYPKKEDKKGGVLPTCLNAKNYGIPQNRERIFVICVRNDMKDEIGNFPMGFDSGIRLKDILEESVDDKYYLSQEIQERFKLNGKDDIYRNELNIVGSSAPDCRTIGQRDITYGVNGVMSTLTATDYKQPKQIVNNEILKISNIEDNFRIRKLTPLECLRLMGFPDYFYYNAKELGMSDSALYKQSGNSIVCNVLYFIFKELFKEYIVE